MGLSSKEAENIQNKKRKKICYVTTIDATLQAFFVPQLIFLKEKGFDVTVICSPSEKMNNLTEKGIEYIPVNITRGIDIISLFQSIHELKKIFRSEKFDVVQYSTPNAGFCAAIASRSANIPVRNYHLMGLRYLGAHGLLRKILKTIEKVSCACSTHIECVSKSNLKLAIEEKIFPKEKGVVIWNGSSGGISLSRFDFHMREKYRKEIRQKYQIKENEFVFAFVGRITRDKGVNELLQAFENIDNAKLMMVGNEEDISTIDSKLYTDSKADASIVYTGAVSEVEKYYAAADILVLPSYREGFGNVVIEAAAMGTPAIVTNIAGPIDTSIENKTALWIPVRDSKALEDQMKRIMNDRELLVYLQKNSVEFVRNSFDEDVLNQKIYERKLQLLKMEK